MGSQDAKEIGHFWTANYDVKFRFSIYLVNYSILII